MSRLGQHDGDGIRYAMHLSAPKGGSAQMLRDPAGGWVSWEDYARLKADVERLTFDPMSYLDDQGEWMPRHIHLAAVERLKAEVERLTKQVDYWRIESDCNHGRWLRCLQDLERIRKGGQP